ncbi:MAG: PilT/PilU family type 4a pilus ATPase [Thermodesulfobacteriota bacterium]|nr:PilT/PilU family type 4a pilus ATPase [Thermodesulfobacteriota bacterium]
MRKPELDYILTRMLESHKSVSDLNMTVGRPLQIETSGELVKVDLTPPIDVLTPFQTEILALNLIRSDRKLTEDLIKKGSCDLSYYLTGKARFRTNIFSQKGSYSVALRKLETKISSIDELLLPEAFFRMSQEKTGFILVTGATGTGKSTSLAALLNEMNEHYPIHIITLEDPIEYVHPHKKATFNQREMGTDFDTFASGLRAALRQAPKIIMVGEMRDKETVEIGLSAAETGHLVLSTLHTIDAGQTINRILGMFEWEEERQIRIRLADTVRWIVCQKLLPKIGGGRVVVTEVMASNLRVKEAILNGEKEGNTFYEIIDAGSTYGMQTFDQDILSKYEAGFITEGTAVAYATKKSIVSRGIDTIKSARGEKTTEIENLSMDERYNQKITDEFNLI